MKRIVLFALLVLLVSSAWAEEADVKDIYRFAESYGAEEITQNAYESALEGKNSAWTSLAKWLKERLILPVRQVGNTALGSIVPVMVLAVLRGCMPEARGSSEGARFLLRMLLLLGFSELAGLALDAAASCMHSVRSFSDAISPGVAALFASMGMNGTASLAAPAAALVGNVAEQVFLKYGLPLCRAALSLSIAGNLSSAVNLSRFTGLLKKAANWGTGLITTVFTGLIALQGTISEAVDGLGVRTAKFAVDNASPVIGNGVTDAWDGVVSGVMLTKNAFGVSGITALLAAGIQPLVCCAAAMLVLNLIAALLELFGERETARAAEQIGGICQMALALSTGSMVIATVLLGAVMSAGRSFFA